MRHLHKSEFPLRQMTVNRKPSANAIKPETVAKSRDNPRDITVTIAGFTQMPLSSLNPFHAIGRKMQPVCAKFDFQFIQGVPELL